MVFPWFSQPPKHAPRSMARASVSVDRPRTGGLDQAVKKWDVSSCFLWIKTYEKWIRMGNIIYDFS